VLLTGNDVRELAEDAKGKCSATTAEVVIENLNLKLGRTSFFIAVPKLDRYVPLVSTRFTRRRTFSLRVGTAFRLLGLNGITGEDLGIQ
jgi:hypothetical protein